MARLILRWLIGSVVGTLLVWVSSPWFVSSLNVLVWDSDLQAAIHPPGSAIRWRDEGYATTQIGPHGMPGKTAVDPSLPTVALWGDSQLEGVAIDDSQKIFSQAERLASEDPQLGPVEFLPLARSGQTIADWYRLMPRIERLYEPRAHVIVLTELSDLEPIGRRDPATLALPTRPQRGPTRRLAARLPDFVGRAARNLVRDSLTGGRRELRFAPGPIAPPPPYRPPETIPTPAWRRGLKRLADRTDLPLIIVYAPQLPSIVGGRVLEGDEYDASFSNLINASDHTAISIYDLRPLLIASARDGDWPHGFHNGRPGVGHLNERGNAIVAAGIIAALRNVPLDRAPE